MIRCSYLFAAALLLFSSLASADPLYAQELDDTWEEDNEARIFTSNSNLGLNSTVDGRAILAAILLGILFALVLGYSFLGDNDSSGYGYGYQRYGQQGYGNQNFYQRSDKNFYENDLASQMAQLAEAFKKYEVADLECQMYVACEASQEARHEENGALAKEVFAIMRNMKKRGRKAVQAKDDYVARLLDSFVWGEQRQQELKDACAKHRGRCFEATKSKPKY